MCRKTHGAAFATYAGVDGDRLAWLAGEALITHYESSPNFFRAFCRQCGSTVPGIAGDGHAFMPAGCFDEDPGVPAKAHIFVASKAPWYEIPPGLPQFDAWPDPEAKTIERPEPEDSTSDIAGSCLCGTVRYEVRGPIDRVWNCHCSRCQKARATAHATNGFAAIDDVVFTAGEDNLTDYKIPDAKFFTQTFCKSCGSIMPRKDPGRGIAVIPWGSVDTDPGRGPERHIFTSYKAAWHQIQDDLPQSPGAPG